MYTWFRMYSEVIHDPKIRKLSPAQRWVWVGLLCLASESDTRGVLEIAPGVPYEPEDLASLLGVSAEDASACLQLLERMGMIRWDDTKLIIVNWDKRQYLYPSDAPEQTRARQRRRRSKPYDGDNHDNGGDNAGVDTDNNDGDNAEEDDDAVSEESACHEDVTSASRVCHENVTSLSRECHEPVTAPDNRLQITDNRYQITDSSSGSSTAAATTAVNSSERSKSAKLLGQLYGTYNPVQVSLLDAMIRECEEHRLQLPRDAPGAELTGDDWVAAAIEEAAASKRDGGFSLKYVDAILKRWMAEGFRHKRGKLPSPQSSSGRLARAYVVEEDGNLVLRYQVPDESLWCTGCGELKSQCRCDKPFTADELAFINGYKKARQLREQVEQSVE